MTRSIRVPSRLLVVAIFIVLSFPAMAQNKVSVTSLFTKPGQPIPADCQQAAQAFVHLASRFPHPKSGWEFVIVCDEGTWKAAIQRMDLTNEPGEHYGETDIDRNITLFRGWKLIHPDMQATPEHIVAHELAHIMLHSRDEFLVDKTALDWVDRDQEMPGSLVALNSH